MKQDIGLYLERAPYVHEILKNEMEFDTKGVLDLAVIIQYPQYWGTKSREQRFSRLFGVSCPAG